MICESRLQQILYTVKFTKLANMINPVKYGLFLKHYGMGGGALWPLLVTLLFIKVEGQNLVTWGILMCFLQKWN